MINLYENEDINNLTKHLKKQKHLVLIISLLVFGLLILNLFIRTAVTHRLFLFLNIIISILNGWFVLTYFLYFYKNAKAKLIFLQKIQRTYLEELSGTIEKVESFPITLNHTSYNTLYLNVFSERPYQRLLYLRADLKVPFQVGKAVKVQICEGIIIAYEINEVDDE